MKNNGTTIVIGVIGADCHAVGNKIIANIMTRLGFNIINLGVMVGHGEIDCNGLREKCQDRGIDDMLLYVGGNLVIGKQDFADIRDLFLNMGYDRVFTPKDDLNDVAELLMADIENQQASIKQAVFA